MIVVRYNSVIRFYSEGKKHYDFKTSKTVGSDELLTEVMGSVTDMGVNRSKEVLDSINQGTKIIRLVEPITFKWSYLMIDDSSKKYRLITARTPLKNYSLIVGEDVG